LEVRPQVPLGDIGMIRAWSLALALLYAFAVPNGAAAQEAVPAAPPQQVQDLMRLLNDPVVRDWIAAQPAVSPAAVPAETGTESGMAMNPGGVIDRRLGEIRSHLVALADVAPRLPDEFATARSRLMVELEDRGLWRVLLLIAIFLGTGFLVERLLRRLLRGVERWIIAISLETVGDRLRAAAIRLAFAVSMVLAFGIGSVGAFLLFDWPPFLREIVLAYLLAILILRMVLAFSRFALAPGGERFRLLPLDTPAAWYWYRRIGVATGWLVIGWVTVATLRRLGLSPAGCELIAYSLGIVLLAIGIEAIWHRPQAAAPAVPSEMSRADHRLLISCLMTGYFALLWVLWFLSMMPLFWLLVTIVALPLAIRAVRRAVNHLLRPPGAAAVTGRSRIIEVCLDRGLRALLIVGAAFLLAKALHIDLAAMTMQDTMTTRLVRGVLKAVVIALVAEFLWHFFRAVIDTKLAGADPRPGASDEEIRRGSRLRTLLPILRNILMVVIVVLGGLMVLSSMGIEIGPLIAGAGVAGVAIGFGAQTVVKDVISGMFYLLDDAFRVGEYIQSGSYKGTVESFSLRSVKLRHQRGPIYTVPFGELGAVQNMSRDWVIDKLMIGVAYGTDLEKARKLIKDIGKDLAANPEYKPHILEPLKMQGVEQFGEYAIQIRMKMMTKPGQQFTIRRKALAAINQAFKENGIEFARPTFQMAGDAPAAGAAGAAMAARMAAAHAEPKEA
jgi:small-conductance mechanosensitive channel